MLRPAIGRTGLDRLVCCGVAASYVAAFSIAYPLLGPGVCALTVVPVAAAGWCCGVRAGLLAALASLVVNTSLAGVAGAGPGSWGPFLATAGGPTLVVCAAAGVASGRARELCDRLRDQVGRLQRAEAALREHEELLRNIIAHIPCGVFWKDRNSVLLGCNEQFARDQGFSSPAEVVGKNDYEMPFTREEAEFFRACDRQVVETGRPLVNVEEEQTHPGGVQAALLTSKVPLRNERGEVVGVLGVYQDITERKRLEKGLRQAQKLEAVGQLAGGIAHDFNNLLTIVLASLDLVCLEEGDANAALLEEVRRAAVRAADLTGKLLGYARKKPLRVGPVRVAEAAAEVADLLRPTLDRGIVLEVNVPAGVPPVRADAGELHQVLLNLCLNARDAMPGGGTLRIAASAAGGERVRLSVADTGCGIPPEVREHIFEPFFTTKPAGRGTGLGLAMVHGIVTQHGGRIEVDSAPRRGTRFDLYLPTAAEVPATEPRRRTAAAAGEVLLLVDDEEPVRRLAREVLERHGYRVLEAADGHAALAVHGREGGAVDLIVLDLIMPGLSGADALRRLTVCDTGARVLVCSSDSCGKAEALACPQVVGFLAKPYLPDDLLRAVRGALVAEPVPV